MFQSVPVIGRSRSSGSEGMGWLKSISLDFANAVGRFGYSPPVVVPVLATLIEIEFEVTLVCDGAVKLSVRAPAVPVIARLVKLATPFAFVVAVAVPPRVPPPLAIAAVTTTP